ncbi:DegT/DnrJ/EryC1/StrS family aminotransferase [Salibaculum halophilum]|uniref:DegT/DnrJ/EryC1/StrS family aminotransferase n=1 Tax=Salibaculum halophilum TaxID=1914408 RepID=UPI000A10ECC1|nr:DegT/DnrJ/EryC1/StrS family aminotransferase [Salibaculum halophilum]
MEEVFTGTFTQQEPIPEAGIAAAVAVMRHGRLHRYNTTPGEVPEVAALEEEFAASVGAAYCLAVASGGYALATALRACGVGPGDRVLTNAFTLAPVPGAIASLGAQPVFVGVTEGLVIDLDDLAAKAGQADVLLLSHMRGHICDMDRLVALCEAHGLTLIEDCAHTMGAHWRGRPTGCWGRMGCFSTQTYKHMNSGEGGLLISDDAEAMARAILLSGSYMLFDRHRAAPPPEAFAQLKYDTPNVSGRMDNLRAAILRPQLADLDRQCARWNALNAAVDAGLAEAPGLTRIDRVEAEGFVASSYQFLLLDWPGDAIDAVLARCARRGVELKWFGAAEPQGFTSRYDSWHYAPATPMPETDRVLRGLIDMRLPLTFTPEDCAQIARIIRAEVGAVWQAGVAAQ